LTTARVERGGAVHRSDETLAARAAKSRDLARAAESVPERVKSHAALVCRMRHELEAAGFPLRVHESVRLRVVGDVDPGHADRCLSALAAPGVGLVEDPPDLAVRLYVDPSQLELSSTRAIDGAIRREKSDLWDTKIYSDAGCFDDMARFGAYEALAGINFLRLQLAATVEEAKSDGKLTIASCSSVANIERFAGWLLSQLDKIEPGSPLEKSIAEELGCEAPFDRDAKRAFKRTMGLRIKEILDGDATFSSRRRTLEDALKAEAAEALRANVLVMVPSGNSYFGAAGMGDPGLSRPIGVGDNAIVVVGALRIDPEQGIVPLDAESVAPSQIVGLGGPLGDPPLKGSSYAVPFIAALAGLAASAAVGISAADLRGVLIDPRWQTEIEGRRNPGGLPDVVAVCRAAKEIR
jgi:hypothetical protein